MRVQDLRMTSVFILCTCDSVPIDVRKKLSRPRTILNSRWRQPSRQGTPYRRLSYEMRSGRN
jgi:hypothetical protein